jgi:hypothetical protein
MSRAQRTQQAIERTRRVHELHNQGMSNRDVARKLNCDEKTVRRDIEKSKLPEQHQLSIANGAPAEPLLRQAERERKAKNLKDRIQSALVKRPQRLAEEARDGRHSNATAKAVSAWLASSRFMLSRKRKSSGQCNGPCWRIVWPMSGLGLMNLRIAFQILTRRPGCPDRYSLRIRSSTVRTSFSKHSPNSRRSEPFGMRPLRKLRGSLTRVSHLLTDF